MEKKTALALSLGILLLAGCKSGGGLASGAADADKLVGTWQGTQPNPMKNMKMPAGSPSMPMPDIAMTFTFNKNGSFSIASSTAQITSEVDGSYTYNDSGKQLTLKMEGIKIGNQSQKIDSSKIPPSPPQTVTWKSDNEIVTKFGMSDVDLKRK